MSKKKYRILKIVDEQGGGVGPTFEYICVGSKIHASIVRNTQDGSLLRIQDMKPCNCVDREIFPELALALDTYRRRHRA